MPVDVQLATHIAAPDAHAIEAWAAAALTGAGKHPAEGELCVRVVDEDEIQELNRRYRHKDSPTNVLSFPAGVELPDSVLWGDVVVCAPVIRREAGEQSKRYEDHFAHIVVHGVLHLLGYDHQSAGQADVMEKLEIEILDGFDVSDPYGEG